MKKLILIMAVLPTIASFGQNQNNSLSRNQKGETVDQYFDAVTVLIVG
jgi:prolyl oligopeptidase